MKRDVTAGLSDPGLAPIWYSDFFADGQHHQIDGKSHALAETGTGGPIVVGLSGPTGFFPEKRLASGATIEFYHGSWQDTIWQRYQFLTLLQLQEHALAFHEIPI